MNTQELLAALTIILPDRAMYFEDNAYMDWSIQTDEGCQIELGDGTDACNVFLSWDDVAELHRSLTLMLLKRAS